MTPDELLERAADEIRDRGWSDVDYEEGNGSVCITGAIRAVLGGSPTNHWAVRATADGFRADQPFKPVVLAAYEAIVDEVGDIEAPSGHFADIEDRVEIWNDEYAQDAEHVLDVLTFAAKRARGGAQ